MARFSVENFKFHGLEAVKLKDKQSGLNGILVVGWGSNLISLEHDETGVKILRTPNSANDLRENSVGWGFPVLMPPNRIEHGRFTFEGREYIFEINEKGINHIHGLVHNLPWRIVATDTENAAQVMTAIRSDDHPSIKHSYPHSFELRMTFSLKESRVDFRVEAENLDSTSMPFGIGFHPYFNVPLMPDSAKENCTVQVPAKQIWELADLLPTGKKLSVSKGQNLQEPVKLSGVVLDDVYTDLTLVDGKSTARLADSGAGIAIEYGAGKEFKHWVVWTGHSPEDPFVCLEPYTWVTNAPNMELPHEETGLVVISPGNSFTGNMWVEVVR
ncbi:MAG: aldose 1-epimerase [Firmicutes bacterium]|nr:aldose 1-epimerase [Bacillota bacterium]